MKRTPTLRFLLAHPAHLVALGFGTGLSPIAPGTVGTLLALPLDALLRATVNDGGYALAVVVAFAVGVWAADRTGRDLGVADHGAIVWDEVVAFLVVLYFVGADAGASGVRVPALPAVRHRQAAAGRDDRPRMATRRRRDGRRPGRRRVYAAGARAVATDSSDERARRRRRHAEARRLEEMALNALAARSSRCSTTAGCSAIAPVRPSGCAASTRTYRLVAAARAKDRVLHRLSIGAAGLPAIFRMLPFAQPAGLDAFLAGRGWGEFERTLVCAPSLAAAAAAARAAERSRARRR